MLGDDVSTAGSVHSAASRRSSAAVNGNVQSLHHVLRVDKENVCRWLIIVLFHNVKVFSIQYSVFSLLYQTAGSVEHLLAAEDEETAIDDDLIGHWFIGDLINAGRSIVSVDVHQHADTTRSRSS